MHKNEQKQDWDRHAMYINIPFSTLMYIACLCPSLVSVHFYAIPIFTLQIFYSSLIIFFTIVSNNPISTCSPYDDYP